MQEELSFFGIDFEDSNRRQIQQLFDSNPVPEREGFPRGFKPKLISNAEIDSSLEFKTNGIAIFNSLNYDDDGSIKNYRG